MNIAIIEPIGGHGGMDYYDYGLAYGLGENDVQVFYYTCDKTKRREFKNVHTFLTFQNVWNSFFLKKVFQYWRGFIKSFRDAKRRNVELVHLHFFTFRIIDYIILKNAKRMGFKIIATIHDVNSFDKSTSSTIEKKCYQLIDSIIVHNYISLDDLKNKIESLNNISVIPHGNYLPFISKLNKVEPSEKLFTILFFGQIKKVKGLDILLKSIKIVKQKGYSLKLIVAGKTWKADLDYYKDLITTYNIEDFVETNFTYIPDQEVSRYYERADLIVLPYTEIYQSGVLLLTMSYEKPILSSDLRAFKETIVDKETGFLFENKNSEHLAQQIIYIMGNLPLLEEVTKNAKNLIENKFDWIIIGKETKKLYKKILS